MSIQIEEQAGDEREALAIRRFKAALWNLATDLAQAAREFGEVGQFNTATSQQIARKAMMLHMSAQDLAVRDYDAVLANLQAPHRAKDIPCP